MIKGIPASNGLAMAKALIVNESKYGVDKSHIKVDEESVLIIDVLTHSQATHLNPEYVKGIICEHGGVASHSTIIARNLEIPAIVGSKGVMEKVADGDIVFVDGSKGEALVVTDDSELVRLSEAVKHAKAKKAELLTDKDSQAVTTDGKVVELYANVGALDEVKLVAKYGGDGIGYYRTEFLYMEGDSPPGESIQFDAYKETVEQLAGKTVMFKTFDIGGDKEEVAYLKIPKEDNPFLGWRAVRICLDERHLFKTQLRALLRASAFGKLQVLVPMISSVVELRTVRMIIEEVKDELRKDGIAFDEQTELGIVVEIPSAAVCADILAREADFFSVGTNDLTQYTLAVDRGNEKVAKNFDFFNPSVLRLVKMTIDASHKAGKYTSMCGESAGNPIATILLLGLGLDSFSMGPSAIPKVKKIIKSVDLPFANDVACKAMELETGEEIRAFLMKKLEEIGLDYLVLL